ALSLAACSHRDEEARDRFVVASWEPDVHVWLYGKRRRSQHRLPANRCRSLGLVSNSLCCRRQDGPQCLDREWLRLFNRPDQGAWGLEGVEFCRCCVDTDGHFAHGTTSTPRSISL